MNESTKNESAITLRSKIIQNIPILLFACGAVILIITLIHKYISTTYTPPSPLSDSELAFTDTFGESYNGSGALDKLYSAMGGDDPLKNGNLTSRIDIDTDKYSCSFDATYQGDKKKRVICSGGCFNNDENSTFCEQYIYNDRVNGGKSLDELYDEAGGNDGRDSGRMISKVNVDTDDHDCGFYINYTGNNKRTVDCTTCNEGDEGDNNSNLCKKYVYKNRNDSEELGDTLLDNTYIDRRNSSEPPPPPPPPSPPPTASPPPAGDVVVDGAGDVVVDGAGDVVVDGAGEAPAAEAPAAEAATDHKALLIISILGTLVSATLIFSWLVMDFKSRLPLSTPQMLVAVMKMLCVIIFGVGLAFYFFFLYVK
jgi:hypothetical protein